MLDIQDRAQARTELRQAMSDVPVHQASPIENANPRPGVLEGDAGEEGFLHLVAREGRTVLRWVMIASAILTVITMMSPMLWFAPFPAGVLLGAYVLLLLADHVERRSDAVAHAEIERREVAVDGDKVEDHAEDDQLSPVPAAIVRRESKYAAIALGGILLVAVVYAGLRLPWEVFAIGVFVVFCYMLMVAAPFWLGQFENDIEIQQHRMENKPEPAAVRTS